MKIRTKITLITGILVLVSLLLVLSQYLLEKQRTQVFLDGIVEEEQKSFNLLLNLSGSDLEIFATDYTYWDDMVDYVHNPDPAFAKENIEAGLVTFNASEAYVYDVKGNFIYGHDREHATEQPNFSEELIAQFYKNRVTHFFDIKNNQLTEFRVATIHPTDDPERRTEPQGLFIVGKHWGAEHLATLENISGTTIVPSGQEIPKQDVISISFPYSVRDWKGDVIETFTVISPHPVVDSVQHTSERQLWVVVGSLLLLLLLVYIFLQILVGRPIEALSRGIEKKDIKAMKKMKNSSSEFGTLAKLVLDFSEHEAVIQSKAKDEAILSAVGSGLIAVDYDKKITLFNVEAERMLGVLASEVLGLPIDDILKIQTREGTPLSVEKFPISRALKDKTTVREVVLCVRPDGGRFPAVVTASPVLLGNKIIGAVKDLRDITAEETLERGKRDFVSLVAHELRTPLTSIGWAVEKLESNQSIPTDVLSSSVPYIKSALVRTKALVSSMVDVSKIENGSILVNTTDIDLSFILSKSIEGLRPAVEAKKIKITIKEEAGENDKVRSDERLLQIIVNNLISNAVKYSNENSEVVVTVQNKGGNLTLSVANTGPGIPIEEQPQIFSKMFRATNARLLSPDGVGLGLYISKSFMEKLGGTISFVSTPGKETVFTLHLPGKP